MEWRIGRSTLCNESAIRLESYYRLRDVVDDPLNERLMRDWTCLTRDLFFNSEGKLSWKPELWADIRSVVLPQIIDKVYTKSWKHDQKLTAFPPPGRLYSDPPCRVLRSIFGSCH